MTTWIRPLSSFIGIQWTGDNLEEMHEFVGNRFRELSVVECERFDYPTDSNVYIMVTSGYVDTAGYGVSTVVKMGNWIVHYDGSSFGVFPGELVDVQ